MKKIALCLIVIFLSSTYQPIKLNAVNTVVSSVSVVSKPIESLEVKAFQARPNKINATDALNPDSSDKKNMLVEVHPINHQLKGPGVVYLSVGTVIVLFLLLRFLF